VLGHFVLDCLLFDGRDLDGKFLPLVRNERQIDGLALCLSHGWPGRDQRDANKRWGKFAKTLMH
jgi:hypothetical protein